MTERFDIDYLDKDEHGFPVRFLPGRIRSDVPTVELVSLAKVDEVTVEEKNARLNLDFKIRLAENERTELLGRTSLNPHIWGQ